jgi:threonine/homoserine/homoserine lactone efflux protein
MLGIHDFWIFVFAGLLLNITPGPDVAYIVARSTQLGWRGGATAAIAIGAGCFVHIAAATLGISAVIAASALAFSVLKWVGALYLIYVGARLLLARAPDNTASDQAVPPPAPLRAVFWQGFLTNALNPKVAMFFLAFLPQFIDADAPSAALAFATLGLVFNLNGTLWNLVVAWFASRLAGTPAFGRARVWVQRAIGGTFIVLGARLAWTERP